MGKQRRSEYPPIPLANKQKAESLAVESVAVFREMDYWANQWNEIAAELSRLGYDNTIRIIEYITGGSTVAEESLPDVVVAYDTNPVNAREEYGWPWSAHEKETDEHGGLKINQKRKRLEDFRSELGEACSWICVYCQTPGTPELGPDGRMWHIDHLFAKSNGGDSREDNLILACATCNLSKNRKLASEILLRLRTEQ